jgi:hypothetical protein
VKADGIADGFFFFNQEKVDPGQIFESARIR